MKSLATLLLLLIVAAVTKGSDFNPAASATNTLGLDLFRKIAAERTGKNVLLSPYSIESAFAMAFAGADGATRAEMMKVLHLSDDDSALQSSFSTLNDSLDAMVKTSLRYVDEDGAPEIEWRLANRLFGQRDYPFREYFISLLRDGYHASFEPADFRAHPEQERAAINRWVEGQTKGKIKDLISPHGISGDSRLVLVNALYLRATWMSRFKKANTAPHSFHLSSSDDAPVSTMSRLLSAGYAKREGFTALTLLYVTGQLQFLILLPDEIDGAEELARKIRPETLADCAQLPTKMLTLFLPRFRLDGVTLPLAEKLQAMGLKSAFDLPRGSANFDRIAPRKPDDYLFISEVFHQAFIVVDEDGTEGSAATAMVAVAGLAMPAVSSPPVEVHVDHPFLFAVQHRASGVCLFLGRISDPR